MAHIGHAQLAQAGDIGSYATFGMLIGALASGAVSDWAGRKKTSNVSTALFSLASALCATAGSLGAFGFGRFVAGIGLGGLRSLRPAASADTPRSLSPAG
ncbi:MFS transporter [Streptomyces sp. NPDC096205]|uniref:MFS transporter n=1 Tax=Streptomyces sp. NPDC096205 TaxID=3366081 RepID=UPI0037F2EEE8